MQLPNPAPRRVLYVLGAGFSAAFGLPVIANFLLRARDLRETKLTQPQQDVLEDVFASLDALAPIRNYFHSDLFNIEEVLSILEMRAQITKKSSDLARVTSFRRFIVAVISAYSPTALLDYKAISHDLNGVELRRAWHAHIFGTKADTFRGLGHFASNLCGHYIDARYRDDGTLDYVAAPVSSAMAQYAVITFNYDQVLESAAVYIRENMKPDRTVGWLTRPDTDPNDDFSAWGNGPRIAKLHGCITDPSSIVAPSFNKTVHEKLLSDWRFAGAWLNTAHEIRFIGYGLPASDGYVKGFLKAMTGQSKYLRRIDILCKDPDGSVERRYRELFSFGYLRCKNDVLESYLNAYLDEAFYNRGFGGRRSEDAIERNHERFFSR